MPKPTNRELILMLLNKLQILETKVDIIDERTESYPKLYDNVDKLVGEILENRQERTLMNSKLIKHDKRIGVVEKLLYGKN